MTNLVRADQAPAPLGPYQVAHNLAVDLARTEFVPEALRGKPASVMACILYGEALGINPMHALSGINVIKGKPSASAELMRSLVLRAGHTLDIDATDEFCRITGTRTDGSTMTVTWGAADAKRAGLNTSDQYQKRPRAMYLARATSELCRALFADVIAGMSYTPEDLGDGILGDPSLAEVAPPSPEQVEASEVMAVFERLRELVGTPTADQVKAWATAEGGSLKVDDLRDPTWRAKVVAHLDALDADADIVDAELVDAEHEPETEDAA